jgi:hypothetical protein
MPRVIKSTFRHLYIRFIKEPMSSYTKGEWGVGIRESGVVSGDFATHQKIPDSRKTPTMPERGCSGNGEFMR